MSSEPPPAGSDAALAERVRQVELRITAQATFLAAAYHRGAVLSGVLFAVVAGLFGVAVKDWSDWLYPPLMAQLALILTMALVLVSFSMALSTVSLPGADDSPAGSKDEVLEALLDNYRVSSKKNARRLLIFRYLFMAAFGFIAMATAWGGIVMRGEYLADTGARRFAGDCWWDLSTEEKGVLRDEHRPRGGLLDEMANFLGRNSASIAHKKNRDAESGTLVLLRPGGEFGGAGVFIPSDDVGGASVNYSSESGGSRPNASIGVRTSGGTTAGRGGSGGTTAGRGGSVGMGEGNPGTGGLGTPAGTGGGDSRRCMIIRQILPVVNQDAPPSAVNKGGTPPVTNR